MFCPKCGTKAIEGADFCQKCGTKLIKDNEPEQKPGETASVTPQKPVKKAPTEPPPIKQPTVDRPTVEHSSAKRFSDATHEASTSRTATSTSENSTDVYVLLKENITKCPSIKSIKQAKNGICLQGRIHNHFVTIASGQAGIGYALAFPFSILYFLFGGSLAAIATNIGWNAVEYGFYWESFYTVLLVVCLLSIGLAVIISKFCGIKEKTDVETYVREILDSQGVTLTTSAKKQSYNKAPQDSSEKKKYRKLPIILGVVVLTVIIVALALSKLGGGRTNQIEDDEEYTASSQPEEVHLSETYVNGEEGFSFMYPSNWEVEDVNEVYPDALVSIANKGILGMYARIAVTKELDDGLYFTMTETDYEHILNATDGFNKVKVTELADAVLDGHPAKKLSFTAEVDGAPCELLYYFYVEGPDVYAVICVCLEEEADKYKPIFDAIMDSYTITPPSGPGTSGIHVNSMDEAQKMVEDWLITHPMGPMAGAGEAAENDVPSISAEYFVLELWEAPREFRGLVYVRKSDGYMIFHDTITDEEYDLDTWYEFTYSTSANGAEGDLTFRGVSLTDWIGGPADIAYDVFGWPDYGTIVDGSLYSGGEYFGYNVGADSGISFVMDYQTDGIGWIIGAAEAFEVNGITLDMTRTKLIDLFGAPESEGVVSDELEGIEYYAMNYTIKGFPVEISMPSIDSAATDVMISQGG